MLEEVSIIKFDEQDIIDKSFYDKTKLNFEYNNRKIFKNNGIYNEKFDNEIINCIKFNGYYISCCELPLCTEFDIGFCESRCTFEKNIIKTLKKEFKYNYVLIRVSNPSREFRVVCEIEKEYQVIYSIKSTQNIYIIEYNSDIESKYTDYIEGYMFGVEKIEIKLKAKFNVALNLESIQEILSQMSVVVFKIPIYSNYNLLIFSV